MALGGRQAGRRLVEQQHPRAQRVGQRHLQQALLAVRQLPGGRQRHIAQAKARQQRVRLVDLWRQTLDRPQRRPGHAVALAQRQQHRFQRAQAGEQRVDLEAAHQASLDPLLRRAAGDVLAIEHHAAGSRRQHARDQCHQRALAGAVGADHGMAFATRDAQVQAGKHVQAAKGLGQAAGLQHHVGRHRALARQRNRRAWAVGTMPLRKNATISTSSRPIQKYQ